MIYTVNGIIFKPEKISTKLGDNLYGRVKILTFNNGWPYCGKDLDFSPTI